eukprot:TRINITY_DN12946_c0_g1_i2.p1 TRINITY_DN12946_c0_g1~~TRINITY_DN12946_c0_g1_i2.p1  ORF type:complete len:1402 (+),score=312.18 TRINITY_DN12946_c0_g1_i2:439-4644(+)
MTMGRGADGGQGSSYLFSVQKLETLGHEGESETKITTMDVISQALKALALKHPFDVDETPSDVAGTASHSQARPGETKRKPRKVHGRGTLQEGAKLGGTVSRETRSRLWAEMEEYFRPVTAEDIMALQSETQFKVPRIEDVHDPCLFIPFRASRSALNRVLDDSGSSVNNRSKGEYTFLSNYVDTKGPKGTEDETKTLITRQHTEDELPSSSIQNLASNALTPELDQGASAGCSSSHARPEVAEAMKQQPSSSAETVTTVPAKELSTQSISVEPTLSHAPELNHETSMCMPVPSPKRQGKVSGTKKKLSSTNTQLKKIKVSCGIPEALTTIISPSEEREEALCHVCNGRACKENEIVCCHSCGVAIHKECYGVREIVVTKWLCSWCLHSLESAHANCESTKDPSGQENSELIQNCRPCLLCPKSGGALKPVIKATSDNENKEDLQFAHLFCCQWIPETYIENAEYVESITNVEGIDERKWELTCCLCMEKYGACIQCSHVLCSAAFHPLCAKEMKLWMGITCIDEGDDVGLWALCPKHSMTQENSLLLGQNGMTGNAIEANILECPEEIMAEKKDYEHCNVDATGLFLSRINKDTASTSHSDNDASIRKLRNARLKTQLSVHDFKRDTDCMSSSFNSFTKEVQQLEPETTLVKDLSVTSAVELEDVPDGIGDSAVDKHSNSKNASLKIQDMKTCESKELERLQNTRQNWPENFMQGNATEKECASSTKDNYPRQALFNLKAIHTKTDGALDDINFHHGLCKTYVHPFIQMKLLERCSSSGYERDSEQNLSEVGACSKDFDKKQILDARKMGITHLAPNDEVEGEVLYLQNMLLDCARENQQRCENLAVEVLKKFPEEQQAMRKQQHDTMLVNEYLSRAREAKKLGRKEKRHKEAQAILAAATAAAASSARISSSRKDGMIDVMEEQSHRQGNLPSKLMQLDEWNAPRSSFSGLHSSSQPKKVSIQKHVKGTSSIGRPRTSSHSVYRTKDAVSRSIPVQGKAGHFEGYQMSPDSLGDENVVCDVCRQQETSRSNNITTCDLCKVPVHRDCYGVLKNVLGGWYCEPCEAIKWQYQGIRTPTAGCRGVPGFGVECTLCGGICGAFRRSVDGRWVHVFCAEWILEGSFRKGQAEPIRGLEIIPRERYMGFCSICRRGGVCLKCNYGHCQTSFHPLCARDREFYMTVSFHGGRMQHKAYCEKHSSEQRQKAELRRYGGPEEMKLIKQMRVELERLRLICERIIRREKLKREVLHCSHNILASKRDCVAFSAVFHSSFSPPDVSSHVDVAPANARVPEYRLNQDYGLPRHERIDEHTVESTASGDSGGAKRVPSLSVESSFLDDREFANKTQKKSKKCTETLQREIIMTPTEASMQNQRLPKGYAYVPILYLAKGKMAPHDVRRKDT